MDNYRRAETICSGYRGLYRNLITCCGRWHECQFHCLG